ncbi:hypothetical protein EB093_09535 [bacterium]|nr:hypothetical protein [bacterium]
MTTFHEKPEMCRPVVIGARGMTRVDLGSIVSILEHSGRIRPGSSMLVLDSVDDEGAATAPDRTVTPFESGLVMRWTGSSSIDDYTRTRQSWITRVAETLSKKDRPDVVVVPFFVLYNEWLPMRAPHDIIRDVDMIAPAGEAMPVTRSSYLILEGGPSDPVV